MEQLATHFGIIFICLGVGVILRKSGKSPESASQVLGSLITNVFLPAFTLKYLHGIKLTEQSFFPVAMAWCLFLSGWAFFTILSRFTHFSRNTQGALVLSTALSNTSFVGFPLLLALFGPQALSTGILTDQPGTFLVLGTLGIVAAAFFSAHKFTLKSSLLRILSYPPFYAMVIALVLQPFTFPNVVEEWLEKLSAPLIPLALLSVGLQLRVNFRTLKKYRTPLIWGLLYKLVLGPALISFLFVSLLGGQGEMIQITLVQAAMPPMIMGAILAQDSGLEPPLANLLVGVGIPLSLVTVPIWAYLLRGI